ncbi:MAG: hypothetical protein A2X35_10115 [Elusimicrobia bacterium GWA2_61_42]|nr:MAG: hypothetical protein A2X35_10115 [Elusimicrobia bacterium GWA2_61_42]OGR76666.1 MAG: hypothetical protein A2X38_03765 [Elusimicrobia bacterium GWC2_61_25]
MSSITAEELGQLPLFSGFLKEDAEGLCGAMTKRAAAAEEIVVREDAPANCVFFLLSGSVRVEKRLDETEQDFKVLSQLGPGDFFGEAVVTGQLARSARVVAASDTVFAVIEGAALNGFIDARPKAGSDLLRRMLAAVGARLAGTSGELVMLYDVSALAFAKFGSEKEFAARLLEEAMLHFGPGWSAGFYLYDQFSSALDLAAVRGENFAPPQGLETVTGNKKNFWQDDKTFVCVLPGETRPDGFIVFTAAKPPAGGEKSSAEIRLGTLAFLSNAIVDNIRKARENVLLGRALKQSQGRWGEQ